MKKFHAALALYLPLLLSSQPYLTGPGKTRHRFAQTVFGVELQSLSGGRSFFTDPSGKTRSFNLQTTVLPRLYIAGTHFWGHAEFYFAFPLNAPVISYGTVNYQRSLSELGAKAYPWAIQKGRLRPFVGFSAAGITYRQYDSHRDGGATISRLRLALSAGLNYCTGRYLFNLDLAYNYRTKTNYYFSPTQSASIQLPGLFISLSCKIWLETTVAAERSYRDGSTEKIFQDLRKQKKLSSWFAGVGPSSAFYTRSSPFNKTLFPYVEKPFSTVFPEISAGYYYQPFGWHASLAFRHNGIQQTTYDLMQHYTRSSLCLENFKYLFDYHGFDPYLGLCISYEWLGFSQTSEIKQDFSVKRQMLAPGLIFGWDILPDKLQWMTLRTNLRYFPGLSLEPLKGKKIFVDQLEFNFIQLVVYPQRLKNLRKI